MAGHIRRTVTTLIILLMSMATQSFAETIQGEACYEYVDTESLDGARYTAVSLAARKALEAYPPFQEATAKLTDPGLMREIFTTLLVRGLSRIKVVKTEEDPNQRKVCRNIEAQADPKQIKTLVRAVEQVYLSRKSGQDTGLPGNGDIQVVAAQESSCREAGQERCLYLTVQCHRNTFQNRSVVRITWHNAQGQPVYTAKQRVMCDLAGDIATFWLRMPPNGQIFTLDVPSP